MPHRHGSRVETSATLGRKCWAFGYLRQIWEAGGMKAALRTATAAHGLKSRWHFCRFAMRFAELLCLNIGTCGS